MPQTLNKVRYIELLKKNQSLENKNTSLYKENRVEYRELISYNVSKNVIKNIKTKATEVKINRQKRIKYRRQQKLLMLEKCYNFIKS